MISFDLEFDKLAQIRKESKLANLRTKRDYRVFSIAPIFERTDWVIRVDVPDHALAVKRRAEKIAGFLSLNGVPAMIQVRPTPEREYDWEEDPEPEPHITITLRPRLCRKIVLASAVLSTIVYYLENRLQLPAGYRLPPIPTL
jgi:hypothetical protein